MHNTLWNYYNVHNEIFKKINILLNLGVPHE